MMFGKKMKKGAQPKPRFIEGNIAVTWINQKIQNMGELLVCFAKSNDFLVLSNVTPEQNEKQ